MNEIRELIADTLRQGERAGRAARVYKTKSKNAQEAHEAFRPTSVMRTPESLKDRLDARSVQAVLADLEAHRRLSDGTGGIRTRRYRPVPANANRQRLRANGSTLVEPGFMAVYQEGSDDVKDDDADRMLPPVVEENETLELTEFTRRPALHRSAAALTLKPAWSRRSKNMALAARRPMPASFRH